MIDNTLDNPFNLSVGGFSDDLSFYMGKIPVITLANKNSNYSLDKEINAYFEIGNFYGEITGNITSEEALNVIENVFESLYSQKINL